MRVKDNERGNRERQTRTRPEPPESSWGATGLNISLVGEGGEVVVNVQTPEAGCRGKGGDLTYLTRVEYCLARSKRALRSSTSMSDRANTAYGRKDKGKRIICTGHAHKMKKEDIKQTQNSIQLPPPRPRQRESRLARLWFQYCLLTGSWAIEPWEKVLFRTLPPPRSSDSNRKLSPWPFGLWRLRFHRLPHRVLLPAHRLQRDLGIPLLISLLIFYLLFSIGMGGESANHPERMNRG